VYQSQFGDLVLWKQLLEWSKLKKIKAIIFITADNKEDWWHRVSGKTIGPRPELVSEISQFSGVKRFWMYSFSEFGKNAKIYVNARLSEDSLKEISRVATELPHRRKLIENHRTNIDGLTHEIMRGSRSVYRLALKWANRNADTILYYNSRDSLIKEKDSLKAISVNFIGIMARQKIYSIMIDSLQKADLAILEEGIEIYQIILVVEDFNQFKIDHMYRAADLMRNFRRRSEGRGEIEVILGEIINYAFQPRMKVDDQSNVSVFD
jgi:hypothetical protein